MDNHVSNGADYQHVMTLICTQHNKLGGAMGDFMNKNFETVEGVNECSKCKGKRTISFTKQVRSSDEGASVFITCIDCKHRFILNS